MEEYEQRYTAEWQLEDRQVLPETRPLPDAPTRLEALLDDANRQTLIELCGDSQTKRQRRSLRKGHSLRRLPSRRQA